MFRSLLLHALPRCPSACAATIVLASALFAQSPLTTTYNSNNWGSVGNQVYFDLDVKSAAGITIKSLDVNLNDAVTTPGSIVMRTVPGSYLDGTNVTTLINWTGPSGTGTVIAQGVDERSHVCFPGGVYLPFGPHAVAIEHVGLTGRYTNGIGLPPVLYTGTAELDLYFGGAQNTPFTLPPFSPRIWNGDIHYELGNTFPCPFCANKVAYGAPCASPCPPFPVLNVDSTWPVLGEPLQVVTTGASPCATIGITMFSFAPDGPTLITLPPWTCFQHIDDPVFTVASPPISGSWTMAVPLPPDSSYCGLPLFVQSATLESPFAVVTSNALALTIGS